MAKDGTARGGQRTGSGRKSKALEAKVLEARSASFLLDPACDLEGVSMPLVKEYMKEKQKNGEDLGAEEIYKETYLWLKERGVASLVSPMLLEQYAMAEARWIQTEKAISEYGFIAKHPTTGAAIQSPYVAMSREYMKQVNQCWYQIYQIVKENSSDVIPGGATPGDTMERLLRKGQGKKE